MTGQLPMTDGERTVLQMIYDRFHERGSWVTFGEVDRPLRRLGLRPEVIIARMTGDLLCTFDISRRQPIARDELKLSLTGLVQCSGGGKDVALFLRLVPWLAQKELDFQPAEEVPDDTLRVTASEIREFLGLPDEATGALARLREIIKLERWGWTNGQPDGGDWYVQVDRGIYRFAQVQNLDDYIEVMSKWEEEGRAPYASIPDSFYGWPDSADAEQASEVAADYIQYALIDTIKEAAVESTWSCDKLLQLLSELNYSYASGNTYSAHAMLRAILDHIPPVLGHGNFAGVANNYTWSKTDKRYMQRLLAFKEQAGDGLHRQISKQSDLLTIADMPPRIWLGRLLQECADQLGSRKAI